MKSMTPETKVQAKTRNNTRVDDSSNAKAEVSKGTIAAMGVVPTLIGIWAVSCFVGGLIASGGPVALVKSWFSAITGM